jgi:cytochrome c556
MTLRTFLVGSALMLIGGCSRETSPAPDQTVIAEAPLSAAETLDILDGRKPLPLVATMANHQKEDMRHHLVAVQEIVLALASHDLPAVERAAGRMGFTEEKGQMCTHMGAAAEGFTEQALAFHRTADRIATAARERNRVQVLEELGATLETCTSCHSTWKQQVVDEATWQKLTSTSPPTHGTAH